MAGRRTHLNEKVADAIVAAVRIGAPLRVAALSVGIPESTFWDWMARGEGTSQRPTTPLYAEFVERVRQAEAEAHLATVATISAQAMRPGSWEAARAWLKMRWAADYPERTEVAITFDVKAEAERIAAGLGLDPAEIVAEAERILTENVAREPH